MTDKYNPSKFDKAKAHIALLEDLEKHLQKISECASSEMHEFYLKHKPLPPHIMAVANTIFAVIEASQAGVQHRVTESHKTLADAQKKEKQEER